MAPVPPSHAALLLTVAAPARAADERHRFAPLADLPLRVAFVLSGGATLIDFAGPWEVFQDVMVDAARARGLLGGPLPPPAAPPSPQPR